MSIDQRLATYEQSYDYRVIPGIPVIIKCSVRNYYKVIKNLESPFPVSILDMLSDAMHTSAMDIEGCVFGYHNNDKISFVLNSNSSSIFYSNKIQKISSVVSSIMTNNFVKYYLASDNPPNITGDLIFEVSLFGMPNLSEVAQYIISEQQECFGLAVSKTAEAELPGEYKLRSVAEKIILLQDLANFNIVELPEFIRLGCSTYKVPKRIEINGSSMVKNKWHLDKKTIDYTKDMQKLFDIFTQSNCQ